MGICYDQLPTIPISALSYFPSSRGFKWSKIPPSPPHCCPSVASDATNKLPGNLIYLHHISALLAQLILLFKCRTSFHYWDHEPWTILWHRLSQRLQALWRSCPNVLYVLHHTNLYRRPRIVTTALAIFHCRCHHQYSLRPRYRMRLFGSQLRSHCSST